MWRLRGVRRMSSAAAETRGAEADAALWHRLLAFDLDDGERRALSFAARLARENGWPMARARQAIEEYRRFLFLAMVAGHAVTPSEDVDQVWHLHLVYTRSYWDRLCGEVLGCRLHHGPTRGGSGDGARFDQQYRATLASYERIFGAPPPPGFWPPPHVRFGIDLQWRRVCVARYWIVPKGPGLALAILIAALLVLPALLGGCTRTRPRRCDHVSIGERMPLISPTRTRIAPPTTTWGESLPGDEIGRRHV
jgi:hypothetical protein